MSELAVIYANRYRPVIRGMNEALNTSEDLFYKGDYKKSLENTMRALNKVEPGISDKLLERVK